MIMAFEPISSANNNRVYTEVAKQNVNKVSQVKAPEEVTKKTATAQVTPAATVSTESKAADPTEGQEEEFVARKMKDAIDKVNEKIVPSKTRCEFSYHEETKRVSIKVIDQNTEEVIKEIPPEETLDMLSKIWELAGLLVDERR